MIMKGKKLYLIGIDSAPLWMIREYYKKYSMKGFAEIIGNGCLTNLESTIPPMTGPSWPSIYTGYRPGEHGVPEFFKMEPNYTKSVVYYDPKIKPPFWDTLSRKSIKSLVVTPAMLVRPSGERNVDMITGFPLPARYTSEKVKSISEKYSFTGEPALEGQLMKKEITFKEASSKYLNGINARSRVSKELINSNEYDLAFICFTEQDRLQHYSLGDKNWREYILPLYKGISNFMEWVEKRAKEENALFMVVSDHGAQPIREKFLMNGWLINRKYAIPKKAIEKEIQSGKSSGIKYKIRETGISLTHRSFSRKLLYDKLSPRGKKMVKSILEKTLSGTSSEDYTRLHDFDYDMKRTQAFASIANCPMSTIFINDERFEDGIVAKNEKKELKRKIIADLLKVKDKNGKRLIIDAFDADDYYEGTRLFIAPDIIAEVKDGYLLDAFGYLKSGGLFMKPEPAKSGDHLRNGIFGIVGYGEQINYRKIEKRHLYVYNIEPTILKYFGLKKDNDKRYNSIF